jgi:hypothetical protein
MTPSGGSSLFGTSDLFTFFSECLFT